MGRNQVGDWVAVSVWGILGPRARGGALWWGKAWGVVGYIGRTRFLWGADGHASIRRAGNVDYGRP